MPAVNGFARQRWPALLLASLLLGACASPSAPSVQAAKPGAGVCGESNWQAQTAQVINKRLGPDVLDQYDAEHPEQGCR
jgi:hypothetical protein